MLEHCFIAICCDTGFISDVTDGVRRMGQRLHEDDSQVRLKVVFAGYDQFSMQIPVA